MDSAIDEKVEAEFTKLRTTTDRELAGTLRAKERAGEALTEVMIPEALDYPM